MTPRRSRGQKNTDDDFWRRHCQAALRSSRTLTRASLSSPPTNWRERDRHCHCRHPMRQQTQVQTRPSRLHLRHADPDSDADAAGVSPVVVDNTKLRATSGSTPTNGVDLRTLITPMDQAMQESLLGNTNARQVTVASAAGETSSIPGSGGQRTNKADSIVSAGTAESPLDADSHKWTLMAVESINRTLSACQPSEEGEGEGKDFGFKDRAFNRGGRRGRRSRDTKAAVVGGRDGGAGEEVERNPLRVETTSARTQLDDLRPPGRRTTRARNSFSENLRTRGKGKILGRDVEAVRDGEEKVIGPAPGSNRGFGLEFGTNPGDTGSGGRREKAAEKDFGVKTSDIIKFAISTVGIYWASPLMSLIDTSAVGVCAPPVCLAALGPASVLCDYTCYLNTWIGVAMTNLHARAVAAKDALASRSSVKIGLGLAAAAGVTFIGLIWSFSPALILAYSGPVGPEILPHALSYMNIRAIGLPAALVTMASQSALLGAQNTRVPLIAVAFEAFLNFFGDYFLVRVLGMGISGAAWATVFSQYAGMALILPLQRAAFRKMRRSWDVIGGGEGTRRYFQQQRKVLWARQRGGG